MSSLDWSDEDAKRSYHRKYRKENGDRLKAQQQIIREEWRLKLLELIGKSKCKDCGHKDVRVLQFDHVRGKKVANVCVYFGRNWTKALAEAKKCDVVCANCHVLRTRNRQPKKRVAPSKWLRLSKTCCPKGHKKIPENRRKYSGRDHCLLCKRERARNYMRKKRESKIH